MRKPFRPSASKPPRGRNRVEVRCDHPGASRKRALLRRAGGDFLAKLRLSGAELSVALVSDRAIRRLNRAWREKDRPTDVLSFPAGEPLPGVPGPRPLGDVIISYDTAKRVAAEEGWSVDDELRRYLAHGLLHLLGHDHQRRRDAIRMADLEERLLGRGGMVSRSLGRH